MEKKRIITWFIFTNDAYTNEAISRELPPEDTFNEAKCFDGVNRKLWRCDGAFITKMLKNKGPKKFHFEIFKREGKYGPIKKENFLQKKKKSPSQNLGKGVRQ